jgi:hypothetical protein
MLQMGFGEGALEATKAKSATRHAARDTKAYTGGTERLTEFFAAFLYGPWRIAKNTGLARRLVMKDRIFRSSSACDEESMLMNTGRTSLWSVHLLPDEDSLRRRA